MKKEVMKPPGGAGDTATGGRLQSIAASILMAALYAARMSRFDLLRAICKLASLVTKWDATCDKRFLQLMRYIKSTTHYRMSGWVGDSWDDLTPTYTQMRILQVALQHSDRPPVLI